MPVKQLIEKKLLFGVIVIVTTQILGMLPALDFLPPLYLKIVSFSLGVLLTAFKGAEMFYEQTAQLEKTEDSYSSRNPVTGVVTEGVKITEKPAVVAEENKDK